MRNCCTERLSSNREFAQSASKNYELQRYCPRPHGTERNGRSMERRPSRQYPSNTLVVQWIKRINENGMTDGRSAIPMTDTPINTCFVAAQMCGLCASLQSLERDISLAQFPESRFWLASGWPTMYCRSRGPKSRCVRQRPKIWPSVIYSSRLRCLPPNTELRESGFRRRAW